MDGFLFYEWVKKLDKKFEGKSQKVSIIVDNCLIRPKINGLEFGIYSDSCLVHLIIDDLKAVELVFLPPNTTWKTQSSKNIKENLHRNCQSS